MNERIQELMIQAMSETGRLMDVQATYQRFAELIVKECLLFTNPSPHEGTDFGRALSWANENIKDHFGVK